MKNCQKLNEFSWRLKGYIQWAEIGLYGRPTQELANRILEDLGSEIRVGPEHNSESTLFLINTLYMQKLLEVLNE